MLGPITGGSEVALARATTGRAGFGRAGLKRGSPTRLLPRRSFSLRFAEGGRAKNMRGLIVQSQQAAGAKSARRPVLAHRVELRRAGRTTTFSLFLSHAVKFQVFTLSDHYRVVVDLPQVDFRLPDKAHSLGLVKTYRYGLFAPGRSRIVLDANGPVVVRKSQQLRSSVRGVGRQQTILKIDLERTDEIGFLLKPPPSRSVRKRPAAAKAAPRSGARRAGARPVIIIDPGHGGVDAGAVGVTNIYEKQITLAVARRLKAVLQRSKRYHVRLTRASDTFVSLDDRVGFSQKHGASLFISIHADAIANRAVAAKVRGATIYTLSERASDARARALAIKENAADVLAGIQIRRGKKDRQVRTILFDLLTRETANYSTKFSNLLLSRFKGRIRLHGKAQKAAAFHVLKQTYTPSVLIELGYMSNRRDEKMLANVKWQKRFARLIGRAVDLYFAKQIAGSK